MAIPSSGLERLAAVSDQGRPRLGGRVDPAPHQGLCENGPHARPDGVRPERVRAVGAEDHRAAHQRVRGPDHRADVARIGDPVQVDAGRLGSLGPDLPPDADCPRPRAELRDLGEQGRLNLRAAQSLARGRQELDRLGPGVARRRDQVLSLRDEEALALATPTPPEAANQLQLLVVGAGDRHKKGRLRLADRPGDLALAAVI